MSVRRATRTHNGKTREYWLVDIVYRHANGNETRVRRAPRLQTRRDAEALERELLRELQETDKIKVVKLAPTFCEFAESFMFEHVKVNKQSAQGSHARVFVSQLRGGPTSQRGNRR